MAHFMSGWPPTPFGGKDGLELLILLPTPLQRWDDSWDGNQGFCVLGDCPDPCAPAAPVMWSMAEEQTLWPQAAVGLQGSGRCYQDRLRSRSTPRLPDCPVLKEAVPVQGTEDSSTLAVSCVCHRCCLVLGLEYGALSKPGLPCAAEQYSQLSDG